MHYAKRKERYHREGKQSANRYLNAVYLRRKNLHKQKNCARNTDYSTYYVRYSVKPFFRYRINNRVGFFVVGSNRFY